LAHHPLVFLGEAPGLAGKAPVLYHTTVPAEVEEAILKPGKEVKQTHRY
jgi:hypothetical protein